MKRTIAVIALALLSLTAPATLLANTEPTTEQTQTTVQAAVIPLEDGKVELRLIKSPEDKVVIKICSEKGVVLFRQCLRKRNQVKITYDISQFPEANYVFEVHRGKEMLFSEKVAHPGAEV